MGHVQGRARLVVKKIPHHIFKEKCESPKLNMVSPDLDKI
jgi:hypothetical protein